MLNNIVGLLDAGVAASTNSYESISTVSVTSAVSSISFTSIPSTYKHLQIRLIAQSTGVDAGLLTFNSDTGANYTRHRLTGNGTTAAAGASVSLNGASINSLGGYPDTANTFGATVIDILDYTDTNKYTTLRSLSGEDLNGTGFIELTSNLWLNTAAVTNINYAAVGGDWKQYSSFALYGIKG